ncbi:hypothetical protein HPB48_015370 [Haemaphysalis longicornis]|uniref:Tick transposon n=1 Tax=Haemaphysalis longicornis TaxID=44386 RepID=A0A9J6GUK1_HAELO|nr:hypothetical protein HPB48_015370 [Haemaphysalis longicornis]
MTGAEAARTHFVGRLGQLEPFDESGTDWAPYEERLTSFLIVNRVPDSDKVHAFLSIIGSKTYGLLKSLTAPELPSTKSFEALKKVLSDHLSPKPSVIGERAKFHRRCQREGESISNFVAELRKLSQTCEFGSALYESLRDRFVCGLLREDIQRVLFTEDSKLTFQKTVERALAMEAAKKSAAEARGSDATVGDVHKVQAESLKADKIKGIQFKWSFRNFAVKNEVVLRQQKIFSENLPLVVAEISTYVCASINVLNIQQEKVTATKLYC